MDQVETIEGIAGLPEADFDRLASWFRERDQARWDTKLDSDSAAGKLDFLFAEADREVDDCLLRNWPSTR